MRRLEHLPGAELVLRGVEDLRAGRQETVAALLVAIAEPRLRALGLDLPALPEPTRDRELVLYALLRDQEPADAYSRYNALLRRLISFEHSLEQQVYRARRLGAQPSQDQA
jgi:hypothetical protein